MGRVDFDKLKGLLANPTSKAKDGKDSSVCLTEFLECVSNFIGEAKKMKEDELAMLIMSMENWKNRKNRTTYIAETQEDKIKIGDIFFTDLGIGYKPEFCYPHPVIILEKVGSMYLVVPTSTSPENITEAYHPIDNQEGSRNMRRVSAADGFKKDCAVILNNARVISQGRLIKKMGSVTTKTVLEELQNRVFELLCSKKAMQYRNLSKDFEKLQSEKELVDKENEDLKNENNKFKIQIEELIKEKENSEKDFANNLD